MIMIWNAILTNDIHISLLPHIKRQMWLRLLQEEEGFTVNARKCRKRVIGGVLIFTEMMHNANTAEYNNAESALGKFTYIIFSKGSHFIALRKHVP